jgi:branched-chain amino acid transport system substrate-binding protein
MTRRSISLLCLLLIAGVLGCEKKEAVRFGVVLPLTGDYQVYAESIQKGLDLALETIAAEKSATPLELVVVDSTGDPAVAAQAADDLYGDGVMAVIGGVTSDEALEMVPIAEREDRVLLSPSASSPELTGISANFYRIFPSDFLEGTKMGNFATQTLRLESAVILASEGRYAKGVQQIFQTEFERNGGTVSELMEFPVGTTDFSGLLDRIQTLEPQAVYLAGFATELAPMIRGLRDRGFEGSLLTTSAFAAAGALEATGTAAAGVFLTQNSFELDTEDPTVQTFAEAYRAKYGEDPDVFAAHGYDALMVLSHAMTQGVTGPSDMWKGMRAIRAFPGVTGSLQFDERGDVQKFPRVYVIDRNLRLLNYEREVERRRKELVERLRQLDRDRRETAEGGDG